MTDFLSKKERSLLMSKIKSRNTQMEEKFFLLLKEAGFRFRKYPKKIFGNPDAANKSAKIVFFFDSAFWHGYQWKKQRLKIGSNKKFWIQKIEKNMARDKLVTGVLKKRRMDCCQNLGNRFEEKRTSKSFEETC